MNSIDDLNQQNLPVTMPTSVQSPFQVETFSSFSVNKIQTFDILLTNNIKQNDLIVTITNSNLGALNKQLDWQQNEQQQNNNINNNNLNNQSNYNKKCCVSFKAPLVGIYTINVELSNQAQYNAQFQAKAYDLSKVFINDSYGKCFVNESYEFSVDASEAGEGQLEIAVNEGEIPNQVQVLDNGKCIVNFVPEDSVPHVVDIKFNGHNVNGCPFVVEVLDNNNKNLDSSGSNINHQQQQVPRIINNPKLIKEERVLINGLATFSIENLILSKRLNKDDILIIDPENQAISYKIIEEFENGKYRFEFNPSIVGDYTVELNSNIIQSTELYSKFQASNLLEQFPFPIKVFDFTKVLVSDVVDGVIGHPVYFFIDASRAGSGNLEIRVSSKTRNVPNYPQSEANAKIRVNFTPTEAVDHSIDIKFNGVPVPGNPFLVKVSQFPQARLPVTSQDVLKYVAIDEFVSFQVDYIGAKENLNESSCQVYCLSPDFIYSNINTVEYFKDKKKFKISFKPTKIGPYKLFIIVNNELLPSSPIVSNVFNINEVKVEFESLDPTGTTNEIVAEKPFGQVNKPFTFTVDASKAGEGTLALAVVSGLSRSPIQTDVKVSEKGHGLYNLTFVPVEFAPHSIDMSFNDRVVPNSPFIVEILDENGLPYQEKSQSITRDNNSNIQQQMVQNFENLSLQQQTKFKSNLSKQQNNNSNNRKTHSSAYGLVNASNIIYLEAGILDDSKIQVTLISPSNEKVPFSISSGSPQPGEPKKPYIEYKPKSIGTYTINIIDVKKDLRQHFIEICDPSLVRITDIGDSFVVKRPVTFCLDCKESGEIQLDSITIIGPSKQKSNGKTREGEQTILGRIKSISSSSSSSSYANNTGLPIDYTINRVSDHKLEVRFVPQNVGKYSIEIRSLGQTIGSGPFEINVKSSESSLENSNFGDTQFLNGASKNKSTLTSNSNNNNHSASAAAGSREEELLKTIVVHGVSLKSTPVNSTGAFIIETNNLAQARDFDVLITDPSNNLVNVQCYLQQDGNLMAEWTPKRVGTHKIEVFYKDKQVPNSPFITEAFDPSGVIIENLKGLNYLVNDKIEFKLNRKEAGLGELDVAITSPVGQDLPIDVTTLDDCELISFKPTVAGQYKMSITFGGYEVPKSPITFIAKDDSLAAIKVGGSGLRCAEVNRSAQFIVESKLDGELKIRIECGDREIVPKVEKRQLSYTVKYKATEIGYATISLYWNGTHIEGSPYSVAINDLSKILFLSGTNKSSNTNNQRVIDYEQRVMKEITVDTSKCGPGELKAEAYCRANPNLKFSLPINQYVPNRYKLVFNCPPKVEQIPKAINVKDFPTEATYMIRFYYNNVSVPENLASVVVSPLFTQTKSQQQKTTKESSTSTTQQSLSRTKGSDSIDRKANFTMQNDNNNYQPEDDNLTHEMKTVKSKTKSLEHHQVDCPIVALRGHGLVDAKCGEKAEFMIDGSEAGSGKPEVRFTGGHGLEDIVVELERVEEKLYRATYVAQAVGVYSLNVLWDGKQVAGCPINVNVIGNCDPNKVLCTGDGLKGGVLGEEIKCFIDTRRAGPGELTALCTGPQKVAFCELLDRGDGTFILYIKPQESGKQLLTIKYGGEHIPKSPFLIKVSGKPDPSKVRVHGPGVEHGVLSLYQSRFVCDTRGAGAGQLTVRIRGPKGAFRMETQRESQKDRTILCKYDPTEPGDYRIEIKWSGRHVPGSPFSVMIFDTQEELNRFLIGGIHHNNHIQQQQQQSPSAQHHNNNNNNNTGKMLSGPAVLHHQVPTMVEYGHYSNMAPQTQQPPFRLQ